MAAAAASIFELAPPLPSGPIQWRRIGRVVGELIRDPDATEKVFELIEATGGRGDERTVQNFARRREGRRLFAEKPSLLQALADRDALRALAPGSFGRAYLAFAERNGFAVDGILQAKERGIGGLNDRLDADRLWFFERLNLMHDLWHVLTGYDTDPAGELALAGFSVRQGLGNRALQLLVAAGVVMGLRGGGVAFARFMQEARRRAAQAEPLLVQRYEELLPRPLDDVRRELGVQPIARAHPNGVFRARDGLAGLDQVAA